MSIIVLVLGILITGAGLVAIGFGIPVNDLDLAHTLIIAGTTALSGGVILIALAAAVAELSKIAEAVRPRPGARPGRLAEVKPAPAVVVPAPAPAPEPRPEPRLAEPPPEPRPVVVKPPEPRPAPGDSSLEVSATAIERLRSSLGRPERPKPEVLTTAEEVPLSPNGGNGTHAGNGNGHVAAEPAPEAKQVEAAPRQAPPPEPAKGPQLDFLFRSRTARPAPAPADAAFDTLWPKRPGRGTDAARGEASRPAAERPAATESPRSSAEVARAPTADPRSVGILKSGVVDGMAYTLYADGSIEAQLPQGTVRFGSIAELRAHIEKNP